MCEENSLLYPPWVRYHEVGAVGVSEPLPAVGPLRHLPAAAEDWPIGGSLLGRKMRAGRAEFG